MEEFKYDVGISFLSSDEDFSSNLAEELSKNFEVFFFPTSQKEIAARDGVDIFSDVFFNQTRINVVLYREKWGQTSWTEVEEAAIKKRIFFSDKPKAVNKWSELVFVNLDKSEIPSWIPPSYIYFDYLEFSFQELIGIIKSRVIERGGSFEEENYIDRAKRIKREEDNKKEIRNYMRSEQALIDAKEEAQKFLKIFESKYEEFKVQEVGFPIGELKKNGLIYEFPCAGIRVICKFYQEYSNAVDNSGMELVLYNGTHNYRRFYDFLMNEFKQIGWVYASFYSSHDWVRVSDSERKFVTSQELADFWMHEFVNMISSTRE